jgi:hypothetical protein
LGKHGRYRTNVWNYAGVNSFGEDRGDLTLHPTVKPVAMVADAIRDCSHRRGIVLDPFVGSGTTLIAAERRGGGYGVGIDPAYCDCRNPTIARRMRPRSLWAALCRGRASEAGRWRGNVKRHPVQRLPSQLIRTLP